LAGNGVGKSIYKSEAHGREVVGRVGGVIATEKAIKVCAKRMTGSKKVDCARYRVLQERDCVACSRTRERWTKVGIGGGKSR
jgi:hypothetical protein